MTMDTASDIADLLASTDQLYEELTCLLESAAVQHIALCKPNFTTWPPVPYLSDEQCLSALHDQILDLTMTPERVTGLLKIGKLPAARQRVGRTILEELVTIRDELLSF